MQFVRDRLAKGRPGSFLLIRLFLPTTQIIRSIARFASLCPGKIVGQNGRLMVLLPSLNGSLIES